jgi:hypothetical protein
VDVKRIRRFAVALVPAALLGACSDTTFEGGGPVSIELSVDRTTARTGQDVTFTYDAKGTVLTGVIVEFGDGATDTMDTAGAQKAHGRFIHAYRTVGTFTAVGTAYDASQGPATDQVVVQVTGG